MARNRLHASVANRCVQLLSAHGIARPMTGQLLRKSPNTGHVPANTTTYGASQRTVAVGPAGALDINCYHTFEFYSQGMWHAYLASSGMVTPGDTLVFVLACR